MDVWVLGPIAVTEGDTELAVGGPRQRRLLAALVLAGGRPVSAERLALSVWGDEPEPPETAARTVQSYVSRLRSTLGEDQVVPRDGGYALASGRSKVDADRFRELLDEARHAAPLDACRLLDDALAMWRGPAFGEFADEPWARPMATRLEELRLVALELRVQSLLDMGAHTDVVPELEELVVAHPLRERFRAQLMLALHRCGRQAEALRSFQEYRRRLADDTGLEPSRDLVELERRIALDDPSLAFVTAGRTKRGYILAEVLAEGAFGTVYRAVQPSVGREVAVKVVKAELADDPDYVRRFEGEARLVARLEHPHIVPLYDFWREPGGAYLVFRLLRGGSLEHRRATEGRWSLEAVDSLVTEIGSALAVAHAAGVVHRDVKPANVLFDERGSAFLADFGIALVGDDVEPGELRSAGSPLYASPEQIRDGVAAARSDQYALAVMAWELLAGVVPFEGETVTTLLRTKLARTVGRVAEHRPDVPEAVDAVLQRAASVDPEARFATMADLLTAWSGAVARPVGSLVTTGRVAAVAGDLSLTATLARLGLEVANPYKGLRAFDEGDAAHFYGRDADADALVALVEAHRVVAVVGPSGSGKSSLVRAGAVPRLRGRGALVAVVIPGPRPLDELSEALLSVGVDAPVDLRDALLDPSTLAAALQQLLPDGDAPFVLVIDQFEELWTLVDTDARDRLLAALVAATEAPGSRLRVIATVRADFYDRPLAHPVVGPAVREATLAITPLRAADLQLAITAPAGSVGVRLEPSLVAELVADLATDAASLPLLQYALTELFEQRTFGVMTSDAYRAIGGIAGALTARADELYLTLTETERPAVRRLFDRLVTPGDGTQDTRRRARRTELVSVPATIIESFGAARLLTFDHDPVDREPTVEIAHEALIRAWPRLRTWLDEDRDGLRLQRHLADSATAWEAAGRPPADLYRGARLEATVAWVSKHDDSTLTAVEHDFLDEARRRASRSRVVARAVVGTICTLLVLALLTAALAFVQQRRADTKAREARANATRAEALRRDADTRRLVAESGNAQSKDLALSLLLAREANARADDPATRTALQSALLSNAPVLGYLRSGPGARYGGIALGPTGRRVYLARTDIAAIEAWDTGTSTKVGDIGLPAGSGDMGLLVSPDGRRLAAINRESDAVTIVDAEPATIVETVDVPRAKFGEDPSVPAFLDDAHLLSFRDKTLIRYDLASRQADPVYKATGPIRAVAVRGSRVFLGVAEVKSGFRVVVIDPLTWSTVTAFHVPLDGNVLGSLVPSADGRRLAVAIAGSSDREGILVDATTGNRVGPYWPEQSAVPAALPDGGFLVGWSSGELRRRAPTGEQVGQAVNLYVGSTLSPGAIAVDGDVAYVVGPTGAAVVSVPLLDGSVGRSKLGRPLPGIDGFVAFAGAHGTVVTQRRSDGKVVVSYPDRPTPAVLEPVSAAPVATLPVSVAVSADGRLVAAAGLSGVLSVFDIDSGRLVRAIPYALNRKVNSDFTATVGAAASRYAIPQWLSSSTAILATLDSVISVDLVTGTKRWEARGGGLRDEVFASVSTDERFIVASDFWGTSRLLRFDDGAQIGPLLGYSSTLAKERGVAPVAHVNWASFVPGTHEAALTDWSTGAVRFLDVDSRTETRPSFTAIQGLSWMAFSADGHAVAIGSTDHAVRLYDVAKGAPIGEPFPSAASVTWGHFTADGRSMLSAGSPAIVWDVDVASWRHKACTVAGRNLTKLEWKQYMPPDEPYRPTCPEFPIETATT
jgi:DNA-binding SARP family transcriptional activator/WD40 repeat protein